MIARSPSDDTVSALPDQSASAAVVMNGVTCEQTEAASGVTACLAPATLDGAPFPYNFSPAGASIDLDQDGVKDLILSPQFGTSHSTPTPVNFFKGKANGKDFVRIVPTIGGASGGASALFTRNIVVGDFNADGKDDFYLADGTEYVSDPTSGFFDGTTQYLYLGSGNASFTKKDAEVGIKSVHGAAVGVPSKDGFALALNTPWQPVATSPNLVNLISVNGSEVTAKRIVGSDPVFQPFQSGSGGFPYLTAIDVNADGAKDIVMLGRYTNNNNVIWLNDGRGNLTLSRTFPNWFPVGGNGGFQSENAAVGDLDGDGLQDMVVLNIDRRATSCVCNSTLRVWINDGAGGFVDATGQWLGTNYQDYVGGFFDYQMVDADDDGWLDIVFTTQTVKAAPGRIAKAKMVLLRNAAGRKLEAINFNSLQWDEPMQPPDQWMPGSVVVLPVNGKPTMLFSRAGSVYSVRFKSNATMPFTLTGNGGYSIISGNTGLVPIPGYGRVSIDSNGVNPAGLAIFSFRENGILVTEAAVPLSAPILSGRIYAEVSGPVNTGIAIANPNAAPATVSFYFTDQNGSTTRSGTTSIPAGGQTARFLDQSPYEGGSSVRGTFTFRSDVPVAIVALRGLTNERGEFLITTLPISSLNTASGTTMFPHFADGGGWTTQFALVNPTDSTITGELQFYNSGVAGTAGRPFNILPYNIPPRSSVTLKTAGTGSSVQSGSVRVVPEANSSTPMGLGVFSFKQGGFTVSEAGVPAVVPTAAVRMYAEMSGGAAQIQTGFAVANPSATAVTVTIDLTTLTGAPTGLTGAITVPANGQAAMFLNQASGLANLPTPFQGVMRIATTSAPVAVVGIRGRYNERGDFLLTTTAPVAENAPPVGSIFPHVVDGGGYSTQVILYATQPGPSLSGTVRFLSQSGQPFALAFP